MALALALAAGSGCARVPAAPEAARTQAPQAGPAVAWNGRGRFSVAAPGRALDAEFIVRADPGGDGRAPEVRLVLLADAGVLLADVSLTAAGATVHRAVDDLKDRGQDLARLLDPWLPAASGAERRWRDGRLIERAGRRRRWFGGDPLLLRRVDQDGWPLTVSDYRPAGGALIAREIAADGPWTVAMRLRLVNVRITEATTPSPP
ncbi:MAG TPA: hypothetical protein VEL07_15095 [Planctomycetota bacterium]|nr:hypothetical protein [Planctomycetota bacterium]